MLAARCQHKYVEYEEDREPAHKKMSIVERITSGAFTAADGRERIRGTHRSRVSRLNDCEGARSVEQINLAGVEPVQTSNHF